MDLERRIELILRRPTEEVITLEELRALLETIQSPIAYDGFEGSGTPHLATGLLKVLKVKDFTDAGCSYIIFLADWHSKINRKFGGDMKKIRNACNLFVEVWKSLMNTFNVDLSKVQFKFGTDVYNQNYWSIVLQVSQNTTLHRALRSLTIAGRKESEAQSLASLFYIPMQVADIFHMGIHICQLGIDQRKANILAREVGPNLGFWKPVCVHHHLLMGLQGPKRMGFEEEDAFDRQVSSKMSKSKPETCIYVTDAPTNIRKKIRKAYCPPKCVNDNPIIDICRNLLLRDDQSSLEVERAARFGGPITFWNITDLERAYREGALHPSDLKETVANSIIRLLEPCRNHFKRDEEAKHLLEAVRSYTVTR